jgi:hypothetical protein
MLRFVLLSQRDAQDNKIIERISSAKIILFFCNKKFIRTTIYYDVTHTR